MRILRPDSLFTRLRQALIRNEALETRVAILEADLKTCRSRVDELHTERLLREAREAQA